MTCRSFLGPLGLRGFFPRICGWIFVLSLRLGICVDQASSEPQVRIPLAISCWSQVTHGSQSLWATLLKDVIADFEHCMAEIVNPRGWTVGARRLACLLALPLPFFPRIYSVYECQSSLRQGRDAGQERHCLQGTQCRALATSRILEVPTVWAT